MNFQSLLLSVLFLLSVGAISAQNLDEKVLQKPNLEKTNFGETNFGETNFGQSEELTKGLFNFQKKYLEIKRSTPNLITPPPSLNGAAGTLYVKSDATGNNDGTCWEDAFTDLQDALSVADLNDQIWVAAGTYLPGNTDSSTFHILQDLELYGGFAGTETALNERDIENNQTILSGDLNGDDVEDDFETNREDNAMTVMLIEAAVTTSMIVDGFIFQGGQADGDTLQFWNPIGGGVFSFGAAQFHNCQFKQNYAEGIGGLFFLGISSEGGKVVDCLFEKNMTNLNFTPGGGLGISLVGGEGIIIENSQFFNNQASFGGGIATFSSNVMMTGCEFAGNVASLAGGAINNLISEGFLNNSMIIDDCTFNNNESGRSGGAVFNELRGDSVLFEITNSIFSVNTAARLAGALEIWAPTNNAVSNISNCVFEDNQSTYGGAIIFESQGENNQNTITGCDFTNNSTSELWPDEIPQGGAIRHLFGSASANSTAIVDDCTFENNTAESAGGAIYNYIVGLNETLEIKNNIFSENSVGWLGGAVGIYSPTDNSTTEISNCIFENNEAIITGGVYYEIEGANSEFVIENCDFMDNKSIATSPDDYPWGGGLGILFDNDVISENNVATIDSCHFENNICESLGGGAFVYDLGINNSLNLLNTTFDSNSAPQGGGMQYLAQGNNHQINISDCDFENNQADLHGGGLEIKCSQGQSETIIRNTEFLNNTSGNQGAGFNFLVNSSATSNLLVENCLFDSNENDETGTAVQNAGGFSLNNFGTGVVNIDFKTSIFENNLSEDGAGAIQLHKILPLSMDSITFENCLLAKNIGGDFAGGIALNGDIHLAVKNTTIAENQNFGILVTDGFLELQNSILYNPDTDDFFGPDISDITSLGGNVIGDTTMNNILTASDKANRNPLFVEGEYQLSEESPAVDVGIDAGITTEFDLAGNDRIQGSRVDAGAFESSFFSSSREVIMDNSALSVFPNPAANFVNIFVENEWSGNLKVRILDAIGREIFIEDFDKNSNSQNWQIDLSNLAAGFYEITISDGEKMMAKSFVKN